MGIKTKPIVKRLTKALFWVLLPAFGLSMAYGLVAVHFLQEASGLDFARMMGLWLVIWWVFGFCAKQVFQLPFHLQFSDFTGVLKRNKKQAELIACREGGKDGHTL